MVSIGHMPHQPHWAHQPVNTRANHWQHAPAELLARITLENRPEIMGNNAPAGHGNNNIKYGSKYLPRPSYWDWYKIYLNQTKVELFSRFNKFTPLIITDLARAWSRGNHGELFWLFVIHQKISTINCPVPGDQNTPAQQFYTRECLIKVVV